MSRYRVVDATGRTLQVAQHDDVRRAHAWGGRVSRDTWLQRWIDGHPGYWSTVFSPPSRSPRPRGARGAGPELLGEQQRPGT